MRPKLMVLGFDGMDFELQSGDRIALLMPVTGG